MPELEQDDEQNKADPKTRFAAEQESRAKAFERDNTAAQRALTRDEEATAAKTDADNKVAASIQENDDAALADGFLTHDDLLQRKEVLSQHHGCLLPHQAVAEGEKLIMMAFPRTTILTHSAADVRRVQGVKDDDGNTTDVNNNPVSPIAPGSRVLFWKGYHAVAESLANHSWLRDNGAYRLDESKVRSGEREPAPEVEQEQE
jgi:hypothetical protein